MLPSVGVEKELAKNIVTGVNLKRSRKINECLVLDFS
jgi:hypothetical protein